MPVKTEPCKDVDRINAMLNHPDVRPWVASADEGVLNVTAQISDPNTVFLMGEYGGQMLHRFMAGIWEVHTYALPEGRGQWAQDMCWANMDWLFTRTDAFEVLTRIPETHRAAKCLAISVGMTKEFHRPDGVLINASQIPVDVYQIGIQDWVRKSPDLEGTGHQFHEWLNDEAAKVGLTNPHEPDPEHDRVVGACLKMFMRGQPLKGTLLYNRWAFISRHATISLVSVSPPAILMDIGTIRLVGDALELIPAGVSGCKTGVSTS